MSKNDDKKMRKMEKWAGIKHDQDGDRINPLTASWYFTNPFEKVALIVLMILGIWKAFDLVFGLFL